MGKLVSTKNLSHEEWLYYRKTGIGGSDAGAIAGVNPYRTAMQVYQDKISDEIEEYDNEAMRLGRDLEEYVAKRFEEATGMNVRRTNYMYFDDENPFMIADMDRMVVGENAALEIKTASPYSEKQWAEDKIPLSYQIQCFHYMKVCKLDAVYVAVLIYGREFKYYKLERDEEIIKNLVQIEKKFWENHVLKRVPPDPDGSKLADSVIAEYYKESTDEAIALEGFDEKLSRREEVIQLMDKLESEKKKIEQELKMYLGNAEVAKNNKYQVSWKSYMTSRLDTKSLQEQEPQIYRKFLRTTSSRRFTVKVA